MADAGLIDIVTALADQIRTTLVAAEPDMAFQVEPRMVLNPTPLTVDIYPGDPERHAESRAFDDDGGYLLTVRARTNTPDQDASIDLLLAMMDDTDPLSLAQAVLEDPVLDGYAASLDVFSHSGFRAYETPSGEGAHLGFQFTTLVLPGRS